MNTDFHENHLARKKILKMLHLYQLLIHLSIQSLSLFLSQDLIFKQSPFPFCIFLCKCKKKKKYNVVTHSPSLLLTSIIISLYPPKTRGSCRDKRTFAPSFSLSLPHCLVYLVHNNFLTYALRYYKRVIFFFFTTDYFAATCTRPSLFCLANCYKKQGYVVWWSLNISQGRLFLVRQVSQHSREKNTSSIISIYFSFEGSFINAVCGCQRMSILFKQNKLWNWVFIV